MEFGSSYELNLNNVLKNNYVDTFSPLNYCFFSSGRIAIKHILNQVYLKNKTQIFIPNYLCEEVYKCFEDDHSFNEYILDDDLNYRKGFEHIKFKNKKTIIFISNYYGLTDESKLFEQLKPLKEKYDITIIYDITHSLFSPNINPLVDFYIASIRKWLPIPDGAIIFSKQPVINNGQETCDDIVSNFVHASILKSFYVKSEKKEDCINKKYRSLFIKSENDLANVEAGTISSYSKIMFKNYNIQLMKKRRSNFIYLAKHIKNKYIKLIYNKLYFKEQIPFVLPIVCDTRDDLRSYLSNNNVYCAIHWDQDYKQGKNTHNISTKILSIPIDQRYSIKDMKLLCKIINSYGR